MKGAAAGLHLASHHSGLAQCRFYSNSLGSRVGIVCILGALGFFVQRNFAKAGTAATKVQSELADEASPMYRRRASRISNFPSVSIVQYHTQQHDIGSSLS